MTYGAFATTPALSWPMKEPDASLDYSYDASADVGTDTLASVALSIAPSGSGELIASNLVRNGAVITVWLAGGVAGRSYVVKIDGTCASGRVFEWTIGIVVDPVFAVILWPRRRRPDSERLLRPEAVVSFQASVVSKGRTFMRFLRTDDYLADDCK